MKFVQDFGLEVSKNTPPPPWRVVKIVEDWCVETSRFIPPRIPSSLIVSSQLIWNFRKKYSWLSLGWTRNVFVVPFVEQLL